MKENVKKSEKQDNHPNRLMERPSSSRHGVTLEGRHDRGSHTPPGGGPGKSPGDDCPTNSYGKTTTFPKQLFPPRRNDDIAQKRQLLSTVFL